MQMDFIKELGYKALDSRLKRISDRIAHDVRKFYKEQGLDIEPNWYLVFMLLRHGEAVPIAAIAERLGYAHPSVVVLVRKMAEKKYLQVKQDSKDRRQQLVSLSPKAIKLLPQLEMIWNSCEKAILQVLSDDLAILRHLDRIDAALKTRSFHDRFQQAYLDSNIS
ncbi:MarR family winged helix-turn-helix transcriptional regulator [Chitinophaga sp. NPDC101104]|uniref:MarR family winged helix-turn-helix transcriptional regulator n=1 Tax=Chitinophaga sp. NPDC101104 TaxID=3390561 RepID=UPI003D094D11